MASLLAAGAGLKNGLYRIVQIKANGAIANASLGVSSLLPQTELPLIMETSFYASDIYWKFTRKPGGENTFTIEPKIAPHGETLVNRSDTVLVERSIVQPIWKLEWVEVLTHQEDEETTKIIDHFRIFEVETKCCWRTNDQSRVIIGEAQGGRALASEMYGLIDAEERSEPPASAASSRNVRAYASNSNPVRTYYFGTQISEENLRHGPSVQLETEARNQGWASDPSLGLWSWFELAIFTVQPHDLQMVETNQIKVGSDGNPLKWLSHRVPITSEYVPQQGVAFGQDHEIWQHVSPGDFIGVLACAQFPAWMCEARSGKLNFQ